MHHAILRTLANEKNITLLLLTPFSERGRGYRGLEYQCERISVRPWAEPDDEQKL